MEDQFSFPGKLYLLPTTLGEHTALDVLPVSVKEVIERTDDFIVENEKTARRFIKNLLPSKAQPSLRINLLNKFTEPSEFSGFLKPCREGNDVGLISEAGCPGIADPGAEIVSLAHREKIRVVPMVGPSSILLAMMSSGLNGQSFTFNGYLPIDKAGRKNDIKNLERLSGERNQAQIFIETPYRNQKMLEDLIQFLNPGTRLCIARDITQTSELIITKTVSQWKKTRIDLHKKPCIFIFQK
ncbi:MAG TPA: SAM-dependent methyltransferase [Salinimicrobium sp.]|nr:SAM-dependent methyltransferase [Salinimicrobium sp.]